MDLTIWLQDMEGELEERTVQRGLARKMITTTRLLIFVVTLYDKPVNNQ